jgi:predicted kinase
MFNAAFQVGKLSYLYTEGCKQLNEPIILLIAGASATGKTTFSKYASSKLNLPLFCKDEIKQIVWDKEQYEKNSLHFNKINGIIAYEITYYFTEQMMKTRTSFILESNFRKQAENKLNELIKLYNYKAITVLFDTDVEILHKRFLKRDQMAERHPGLKSEGFYNDINVFKNGIVEDKEFGIGKVLKINTNDFSRVDYNMIIQKIEDYITL